MKKMSAKKLKILQLITFFGCIIIVWLVHVGYDHGVISRWTALILTLITTSFGGWVLKRKSDDG